MMSLLLLLLFQFSPKSWGNSVIGSSTPPPAYVTNCNAAGSAILTQTCTIPSFGANHAVVVTLIWTGATASPTSTTIDGTPMTANAGNDLIWGPTGRNTKSYILCGVASGSHTFVTTFGTNQTNIYLMAGEYSGANVSSCLDTQSVIATTGAAPFNCNSVTTTQSNDLAITIGGTVSGSIVTNAGSGYTLRYHPGSFNPYTVADGSIVPVGSSTPTMSSTSATAAFCSVVVLKS
jgi:hypothetical protein